MKPLSSLVVAVRDGARQRVYTALVAEWNRDWTVAEMATQLPDVAVNNVRTTLHLLLGEGLMDIAPSVRRRSLTLRLTNAGQQSLIAILSEWDACSSETPGERHEGGERTR